MKHKLAVGAYTFIFVVFNGLCLGYAFSVKMSLVKLTLIGLFVGIIALIFAGRGRRDGE